MVENRGVRTACQHVSHIAWRNKHVFHLMDITVLTGHVARNHLVVEDICATFRIRSTRQDGKVALLTAHGDVVVKHVLTSEVNHHRASGIAHDVHAAALLAILVPILIVLWQVLAVDVSHRVDDADARLVLHSLTLHHVRRSTRYVRQHTQQQRIVDHRRIQQ